MMKKILIFAGVFLALLFGIVFIIPQVVSLDDLKNKVESEANKKINGHVKIVSLKLSTFPWLGFKVTNLTLTNGDAFKQSEMAKILDLGFHVKVRPLLQGKIVGEIILDHPTILLETKANGQKSINMLMREEPSTAAQKPAEVEAPGKAQSKIEKMLESAVIEKFSIRKGALSLVDLDESGRRKSGFDLRHFDLEVENLGFKGKIPVKLGVALFDLEKPDIEFEGILQADIDHKNPKNKQTIDIPSASLRLKQIETTLKGRIEQRNGSEIFVDLQTKTPGIQLAKLEANVPLLKGKVPKGLEGDLNIDTQNKGPIDALETDVQMTSSMLGVPIAGQTDRLVFSNSSSALRYVGKVLTIKKFKSTAFDRDLFVDGQVNLSQVAPVLNLNVKTEGLDINKTLSAFSNHKDTFFGLLSLDANIRGTLSPEKPNQNPAPLVPTWLEAQGTMKIQDGKIATLNLMGETVKTLLQFSPIPDDIRKQLERHEWKMLTTDFSTKNGDLNFKKIGMDYGASKISLVGSILADTQMKFTGDVTLPPSTVGALGGSFNVLAKPDASMDLPIKISGKLNKPITYIDVASLVKRATKETINKVIAPEVKSILKDFSNILQTPPATKPQ